jgi:hypothetical protein
MVYKKYSLEFSSLDPVQLPTSKPTCPKISFVHSKQLSTETEWCWKNVQIEEKFAPFTEDKPRSWTRDGLLDTGDVASCERFERFAS